MIFTLTLAVMTLLGTMPAPDLVDDLDGAADAEFVGRQLVVCWGADGAVAHVTDVEQSGGMTMVTGPDGSFVIGEGKMIEQWAGGIRYLEMTPSTDWRLWDGYSVREGLAGVADPAGSRAVEIRQDGGLRARFVLDVATATPLTTEIYNGNGSLYRYSTMLEVRPRNDDAMLDMDDMPEPDHRDHAEAEAIPRIAGHYWAADSYSAPGGVQVFFTDGLFRFSVFEVNRKSDGGGLADARSAEIGGQGGYHRLYTPGAVSVFWRTADQAYVLVGDLPPDHMETVLADLPPPGRPNVLKRAWRWAFG
ncbi:MAG: hypothetical protein ACR2OI_10045 [Acidimicrobiia bacterium]